MTLFMYKLLHPSGVFLTRGNHESKNMNKIYGFEGEVKSKYNEPMVDLFTEVSAAGPARTTTARAARDRAGRPAAPAAPPANGAGGEASRPYLGRGGAERSLPGPERRVVSPRVRVGARAPTNGGASVST